MKNFHGSEDHVFGEYFLEMACLQTALRRIGDWLKAGFIIIHSPFIVINGIYKLGTQEGNYAADLLYKTFTFHFSFFIIKKDIIFLAGWFKEMFSLGKSLTY